MLVVPSLEGTDFESLTRERDGGLPAVVQSLDRLEDRNSSASVSLEELSGPVSRKRIALNLSQSVVKNRNSNESFGYALREHRVNAHGCVADRTVVAGQVHGLLVLNPRTGSLTPHVT